MISSGRISCGRYLEIVPPRQLSRDGMQLSDAGSLRRFPKDSIERGSPERILVTRTCSGGYFVAARKTFSALSLETMTRPFRTRTHSPSTPRTIPVSTGFVRVPLDLPIARRLLCSVTSVFNVIGPLSILATDVTLRGWSRYGSQLKCLALSSMQPDALHPVEGLLRFLH